MFSIYVFRSGWGRIISTGEIKTEHVKNSPTPWRDSPFTVAALCWCIGSQIPGFVCVVQKNGDSELIQKNWTGGD